jgi:GNAT superfamily N-acetyltransferase
MTVSMMAYDRKSSSYSPSLEAIAFCVGLARTYHRATSLPDVVEARYRRRGEWSELTPLLDYIARRTRHVAFVLATIDDELVGVADCGKRGRGCQFFVPPSHRRKGIGQGLVREVFNRFGRVEIEGSTLEDLDVSPWSYAWLRSSSFRPMVSKRSGRLRWVYKQESIAF